MTARRDSNYDGGQKTNEISLPMLRDRKTEMYVKFAKVMVLFQGPYTDSRSKEIENVTTKFKYASAVISDDTYMKHQRTICSVERTEEYYAYFCSELQRALEEGNNLIVLDPTLSKKRQAQQYLALAYRMQYVFLVFPPMVTQTSDKHVWPLKSQAKSYMQSGVFIQGSNHFKHLFCGWFLHDIDSVELRHAGKLYVQDCLEGIPEFLNIFSRVCPDTSCEYEDKDSNPSECTPQSFAEHFNLDESRQDLAYCVVKIFDGMKSMNDFFKDSKVTSFYGNISKLFITGFVISPHMIAARVRLTRNQKELWDMPDELDERSGNRPCASELWDQSKADLPDVSKVRLISSKSNQTLISSGETFHTPLEAIHPNAKARACHIVLGKAPGAPRKNVDYDVAFALRRERLAKKEDLDIIELENCVVKRLGKYWIVCLREMYVVNGIFASCCQPYSFETAMS